MTFDENGSRSRKPPELGGFFILCDPLRFSASSALKRIINAEDAEGRRDRREALVKSWTR
jgi:hypothetical protein